MPQNSKASKSIPYECSIGKCHLSSWPPDNDRGRLVDIHHESRGTRGEKKRQPDKDVMYVAFTYLGQTSCGLFQWQMAGLARLGINASRLILSLSSLSASVHLASFLGLEN